MSERGLLDEAVRAAEALNGADRVLIATGAGMSAESGVPTYRDESGEYRTPGPWADASFHPRDFAHPPGFTGHPARAWGFFEYLRRTMAAAEPHEGYAVLTRWLEELGPRGFLHTTNVDDLHLRAGVPHAQLWRKYGSAFELQCLEQTLERCRDHWWRDARVPLCELDGLEARTRPSCPFCNGVARPRTQMSLDEGFLEDEPAAERYARFREAREPDLVVVIGTMLWFSWPEGVTPPTVISINPNPDLHDRYDDVIGLTAPASAALVAIDGIRRLLRP